MMFNMSRFIKTGIMDAVGKMPDYWVVFNAQGWFDKGILTQDDMAEIQAALDKKNTPEVVTDIAV